MKMPIPMAISPSRARTSRGDSSPESAEMPEDEHVDEHGEGFHRELRHREVGRAEAEEHHGDAVADRPEREDRRHRRSRNGRRNRTGDDDEDDEDVVGGDAGARHRGAESPDPSTARRLRPGPTWPR